MRSLLKDNHVTLSYASEIKTICDPLKHIKIRHFTSLRIENNNTGCNYTVLGTDPEWQKFFYKNYHNYVIDGAMHNDLDLESGHYFWQDFPEANKAIFHDAREYFSLDNAVAIIYKSQKYSEHFYFATDKKIKNMIHFYLNNMELLKKFIFYFKEKASILIKMAEKQKFIVPVALKKTDDNDKISFNGKEKDIFLDDIGYCNSDCLLQDSIAALSRRQLECLYYNLQGMTAKEIGKLLNLSNRTVESYLAEVRKKITCNNKMKLIQILLDYYEKSTLPFDLVANN